jgi:hypothetical protein
MKSTVFWIICHVVGRNCDVSEEHISSTLKDEEKGERETSRGRPVGGDAAHYPKHQASFKQCDVGDQKTVLFIVTSVRTSNTIKICACQQ